jgi:hypothetical protein
MEDESTWIELPKDGTIIRWKDSNGFIRKQFFLMSGTTYYYDENLRLHRENGPAAMYVDYDRWYWHGKYIDCESQKEFDRLIKLKAFW